MHVVGTAGHVDHGKSTLVRALTGIDPDRLEEEKRRGLTIDLGFAWLKLASGREVGIVDVPGHERFIKNMLAGVGAINATLFIVAANEGWQPQSQEHLDILDLLGVSAALIALTKIDALGEDRAEQIEVATDQIRAKTRGTTLESAPIVPVSGATREGLEHLRQELDGLLDSTPAAKDFGRPRLWIDRVFTMKGSGTIVTGTLTGGYLSKGQEVQILPDRQMARIRGIQSHRKEAPEVGPGNRVALNLSGLEQQALHRGDVLCLPNTWRTTENVVAGIKFLSHLDHPPSEKGAFKLYAGSLELDATIRFLEEPADAGEQTLALIRLDRPAAFDFRDRFILRDSGRRQTLGGGAILETEPPAKGSRSKLLTGARARVAAGDHLQYLALLVEEEGHMRITDIPTRTGLSVTQAKSLSLVWLADFAASPIAMSAWEAVIGAKVRAFHTEHPLEQGIPLTTLRSALDLPAKLFQQVIDELGRRKVLTVDSTSVRSPDFSPQVESPEKRQLLELIQRAGASVPSAAELGAQFGMELVRALARNGELVQVSGDLFYPAEWIRMLKANVIEMVESNGAFTVAQFRDMIGTSRKYAVPVLEYLDRTSFTRRQGDLRSLGPAGSPAPPSA
ncbi:MAG: selenocysteine-specific translation elongation factor [Actinomycetota bacterium]